MDHELPPCAAVIPAAGTGSRVGAPVNKLLQPLCGVPLLTHTLRAVAAAGLQQVVLVCRPDEREAMAQLAADAGCVVTWADGGPTRQASVANGLRELRGEIELVAVHDGARPLVTPELFLATLASAREHGSGVAAVPVVDTLKTVENGCLAGSLERHSTWAMQTPQAFRVALLKQAVQYAAVTGLEGTDEASLLEHAGQPVRVVESSTRNFKVTRRDDYAVAEALLGTARTEPAMDFRVGYGYDVHRLVEGRQLWLGGVLLESPLGLLGHSDADALLHAVCDALLGAIGAGDIGHHFPDTDPQWKGVASLRLLSAVFGLVKQAGYRVVNLDATVIAERPKLAPYLDAMKSVIAGAVEVAPSRVNLKATTHERLGDLGRGLGIAAHAVAALVKTEGE